MSLSLPVEEALTPKDVGLLQGIRKHGDGTIFLLIPVITSVAS